MDGDKMSISIEDLPQMHATKPRSIWPSGLREVDQNVGPKLTFPLARSSRLSKEKKQNKTKQMWKKISLNIFLSCMDI